MAKVANIVFCVEVSARPEDLGLNENCSKEDFERAAIEYAKEKYADLETKTDYEVIDMSMSCCYDKEIDND